MTAFPNSDFHEPVQHYIDNDSDENGTISEVGSQRSMDFSKRHFTEVNWELAAMRQHGKLAEQKQEQDSRMKNASNPDGTRQAAGSPWGNPAAALLPRGEEQSLQRMRDNARPPMLGGEIKFPRCPSPEPARFDVTQGSDHVRNRLCNVVSQGSNEEEHEGLWQTKESKDESCKRPSLWSSPSRQASKDGLWGGYCLAGTGLTPPRGPTGLMTPSVEVDNPFESQEGGRRDHVLPPSPPPSNSGFCSLDEKLETERAIEEEFSDSFITQVYNYLSLGYPSMARKFDGELAKIARVQVSDLRQDDHLASARGYIRLGEEENTEEFGVTEEMCARWKALRLYIREWGRQQPKMAPFNQGGFGVVPRRGSWAW